MVVAVVVLVGFLLYARPLLLLLGDAGIFPEKTKELPNPSSPFQRISLGGEMRGMGGGRVRREESEGVGWT